MSGNVQVSFAGTFMEAKEFASQHEGVYAPLGLCHHGDDNDETGKHGLPMLSSPFKNLEQKKVVQDRFTALGWDEEFQSVSNY